MGSTAAHATAQDVRPLVKFGSRLCKEEPQAVEQWLQRHLNLDILQQHDFDSPLSPLRVLTALLRARVNNNNSHVNRAVTINGVGVKKELLQPKV